MTQTHEMELPTRRNIDDSSSVMPSRDELEAHWSKVYGNPTEHGWRVQMRHRLRYMAPDIFYECLVSNLVSEETEWIDIGGGKTIFPENRRLSRELADRCAHVVGVDPSSNIKENEVVHERVQSTIESYEPGRRFSLATLRMVAEHIVDRRDTIDALDRLIRPGGHVVIYTPNRWAPLAVIAAITPFWLHPPLVRLLSGTDEEDVFPTVYGMNTRSRLRRLFHAGGFQEEGFAYLDNCATFQRFRSCLFSELMLCKAFRACGMAYPENVLLGVYRKQ